IAHAQPCKLLRRRGCARSARGTCFDLAYNCLGLFDETVDDQPARAFRNPTSHEENDKSYRGADQERQPPSQRRIDKSGIEQDDRAACSPMPVPVRKRNSTKLQAFHAKPVAAVASR